MTDPAMIQHTASVLFQPGTVAELRILDTPRGTASGYFDNGQAFTQAAEAWSGKAPAVYCTLNPCTPALLARAANRLKERAKTTTADHDIVRRAWLPLDFDPVRPAGISSTNAEHATALARASACTDWLRGQGWPLPVAADSGNGGHLLYQIDLPNDDASRTLLKTSLEALALYFTDSKVALDTGVFNAGRVWKVYGTMACKGDHLPERPHRLSLLLDAPDPLACVTRAQLEALAALLPAPPKAATQSRGSRQAFAQPFDLHQWITAHGMPVVKEGPWLGAGYRWELSPCPFDASHVNGAAFIVQLPNGAIGAGCHHNGCQGNDWQALRDLVEPGRPSRRFATNGTAPPAGPAPARGLLCDYDEDGAGLWLVETTPKGERRTLLTNFRAKIVADIQEDDGTATPARFVEVEAEHGDLHGTIRLPAKDFPSLTWIPDALGPKARVLPGKYHKEHAHAAIQDLSPEMEHRHTYTHTGWREIDGEMCYLHGTGAITATGMRKDLAVALGTKFERYQLPPPVRGPEAQEALLASLNLRTLGPEGVMLYPLSCAYLAPLRELLQPAPPDFVLWLSGRTGSFKTEYAALASAHFGPFTRLTLPMTFETTGNGLERLLHTPKDSLLVIDDYHPADSRREADAMAQVASRLLRGMGNMASRQRMRRDTTMQEELPPRCLALATGELVPDGHSNNARMFLVSIPPLTQEESQAHAKALTPAQDTRARYAQAMAVYLQWIAQQWRTLATALPARYGELRRDAMAAGCHTREPGQLAYLQLAWETFTQCAVDHGALSTAARTAILSITMARFLEAVEDHAAVLRRETTVHRFFAYLRDGLASKHIYLRTTTGEMPKDADHWGWTPTTIWDGNAREHVPTYDPKQADLLGYVDDACVYLIPRTLEQYLHQAAKAEQRPWPVDMTTLLRELEGMGAIRTKVDDNGHVRRELQKKINGVNQRVIHLYRLALLDAEDPEDESDDADVPF